MSATCGFASWRQSSYVYTVTRRPRARNSRSLDLPVGQACPSWGLSDHDWRPGPTERLSATSTDASSTTQTKVVAEVLVSAIPAPGAPAGPALKRCRSLQHIPADGTPPGDGDNCPSGDEASTEHASPVDSVQASPAHGGPFRCAQCQGPCGCHTQARLFRGPRRPVHATLARRRVAVHATSRDSNAGTRPAGAVAAARSSPPPPHGPKDGCRGDQGRRLIPSLDHCLDALLHDFAQLARLSGSLTAFEWAVCLAGAAAAAGAAWMVLRWVKAGVVAAGVTSAVAAATAGVLCLEAMVEASYKVLEVHHEVGKLESSQFYTYASKELSRYGRPLSFAVHFTRATPSPDPLGPAKADSLGALPPCAAPGAAAGVHLFHGFGTNLSSWLRVQQPLSDRAGLPVTAHDMQGFGLTERSGDLRAYTARVDADVGLQVALSCACEDDGAAGVVLVGHSMGGLSATLAYLSDPNRVRALVLVAPAVLALPEVLGGVVPADAKDAELPDTWVTPAAIDGAVGVEGGPGEEVRVQVLGRRELLADAWDPPSTQAEGEGEGEGEGSAPSVPPLGGRPVSTPGVSAPAAKAGGWAAAGVVPGLLGHGEGAGDAVLPPPRPLSRAWPLVWQSWVALADAAWLRWAAGRMRRGAGEAALVARGLGNWAVGHGVVPLLQPLLLIAIRRLVRAEAFWQTALQRAWWDAKGLPRALVDGYRRPQAIRGWDHGLIRWLRVRVSGGHDLQDSLNTAKDRVVARLARAVRENNTPVLVVHGRHDALVPLSNSRRLARSIPGAQLAVVERCGHCPQEEVPELFADLVAAFLKERL